MAPVSIWRPCAASEVVPHRCIERVGRVVDQDEARTRANSQIGKKAQLQTLIVRRKERGTNNERKRK